MLPETEMVQISEHLLFHLAKKDRKKTAKQSCFKPEDVSLKKSICVLTNECLDLLKLYLVAGLSPCGCLLSVLSGQNDSKNTTRIFSLRLKLPIYVCFVFFLLIYLIFM